MKQPVWLWLNLLSLDAPLVALVWQDFLARCYPSVLRPSSRCVLALTVWAIYLADRLLDVRHPAAENESARHRFSRQNRVFAGSLLAAVLIADGVAAVRWLRPAVLSGGLFVGAAVFTYLLLFAGWRKGGSGWKQTCAAMLFTSGVFLVAWTNTTYPWRTLACPAAAFFALCLGNMALAESWEFSTSINGWLWMVLLALVCVSLSRSRWYAASALSAAGLAAIDRWGGKLSREAQGVLADAVLLAPLLF